jgi:hypothetical protein
MCKMGLLEMYVPVMWYAGVSERVAWHYVYVCIVEVTFLQNVK